MRLTARANGSITHWVRVTDVAGNTSACHVLGTYVHDDIAPATPYLSSATEPASPSNQTDSPVFFGYAERGTTVLLVEDSYSCSAEVARAAVNGTTGAFRIQTKGVEGEGRSRGDEEGC
ncbi:hypothetical protein [Archangium lansingense]|uniref:Uncharacterized protein n=1 Tax=Archangium lansingense TaxID=2995310 RepID=A0ABT3ZY66_9BACT|nr:hypothetical protein [Archangium lansinium]MCY1074318.1 hypothetical protein [Archangium lansinium]